MTRRADPVRGDDAPSGHRRIRDEGGQTLVEFAFILPIVLLLVIGLLEFGTAYNRKLNINNIASEGARWAAVDLVPAHDGIPAKNAPAPADLEDYLISRIGSQLEELVEAGKDDSDPENETVRICFVPSSPNARRPSVGDAAMVRIRIPDYSIGWSSLVAGFGSFDLTGQSWTRIEQAPTNTASWDTC